MAGEVKVLFIFGDTKSKQLLKSNTGSAELKQIAIKTFDGLQDTDKITVNYHDDDFDEWVLVEDGHVLKDKEKLKFEVVDEKGNIMIVKNAKSIGGENLEGDQEPIPVGSPEAKKRKQQDEAQVFDQRSENALIAQWEGKIGERMQSKAQGIAFIIGMYDAKGTDVDAQNMEKAFKSLDFAVFREAHLNASDMKALAKAIGNHSFPAPKLRSYSYIAFYYTGHGGINSKGDAFLCSSGVTNEESSREVFIERDIIHPIQTGQKERVLLFCFDCCLSNADGAADPPDVKIKSSHPNWLIACATSFGKKAQGDSEFGGYWTRILANELVQDKYIEIILRDTTIKAKNQFKQNCTVSSSLKQAVNLKTSARPSRRDLMNLPPHPDHLTKLLKEYTAEYDRIGRNLGLTINQRDVIKMDVVRTPKIPQKLEEVIHVWNISAKKINCTWKYFIQAMRNDDLNRLADDTEDFLEKEDTIKFYTE